MTEAALAHRAVAPRDLDRNRPVVSDADHAHFVEHGYVTLKGLVSPAVVARTRSAVEAAFSMRSRAAGGRPIDWTRTLMPCVDARHRAALAELMPDGEEPELVSLTLQSRPPQPGASWSIHPPHIDGDYPTVMPNFLSVAVLLFLTPAESRGGALVVYPGSHRRYRAVMSGSFSAPKTGLPASELGPAHEVVADPGDAIVLHHLLAHARSTNLQEWTRHAVLGWWRAPRRVVPGGRAFSRMSTIEKANSARYLRHRFSLEPPLPRAAADARTARVLSGGLPAEKVRAHAIFQFRGTPHRLIVQEAAPTTVHLQTTDNLRSWRGVGLSLSAPADLGSIQSIAVFRWSADLFAVVGHERGIRIWGGQDLDDWHELGIRPGPSVCAAPHFNANPFNATRFADGCVLHHVMATDRSRLLCAWGPAWNDLSSGLRLAARAPAGSSFEDAIVAPVFGEYLFGLVADIRGKDGTRPMIALSRDSARYGPLRPLRYFTPTAPRRIRVYARAESYWMVSYMRRVRDEDRFFWGRVDWSEEPGQLTEIRSAHALRQAFFVLGVR